MIKCFINDKEIEAHPTATVLEVALENNIKIPHLCYDKNLGVVGECGLCLIEIEEKEGLFFACKTQAEEGLHFLTQTPKIKEKVKQRLEKILKNHPLTCPSCVKAGECPLQELASFYRPEISVSKTLPIQSSLPAFLDKVPEKCVQCGKCLAFLKACQQEENAQKMPPESFTSLMLSGNLIDLCPAGAIVEKGGSELYRSWEKKITQTIDVTDCLCQDISVKSVGGKVVSVHSPEQGGFISDKARFGFDSLSVQRLDRPYIRVNSALKECSWTEAFEAISLKLKTLEKEKIASVVGPYTECESMLALRDLFALLGSNAVDARPFEMNFDLNSPQSYRFNTPVSELENADLLLVVGADLSDQTPVLNLSFQNREIPKFLIGKTEKTDTSYTLLGETPLVLTEILKGTSKASSFFEKAEKPVIILGESVLKRSDSFAVLDLIYQISKKYGVIKEGWNGYNFLTSSVSLQGALSLGVLPKTSVRTALKNKQFDFVYLLNENHLSRQELGSAFVVYQGIYASQTAKEADVLLPSLSFMEKKATYVSLEGKAKRTTIVSPAYLKAREDWKILRALSEYVCKVPLPYDSLDEVRDALGGENVLFFDVGKTFPSEDIPFGQGGELEDRPLSCDANAFEDEYFQYSAKLQALKEGDK